MLNNGPTNGVQREFGSPEHVGGLLNAAQPNCWDPARRTTPSRMSGFGQGCDDPVAPTRTIVGKVVAEVPTHPWRHPTTLVLATVRGTLVTTAGLPAAQTSGGPISFRSSAPNSRHKTTRRHTLILQPVRLVRLHGLGHGCAEL